MKKIPSKPSEVESKPKANKTGSGVWGSLLVGFVQVMVLAGVAALLSILGFLLFRKPIFERYFERKTGYTCKIEGFDFNPLQRMVELHDIEVFNIDPYPKIPLVEVRRVRLVWDIARFREFPKNLKLLEVEVGRLTLIRRDGNQFNVLPFVESLVCAWGSAGESAAIPPGQDPLLIEECWFYWETMVALDEESRAEKRLEVRLDYEGSHQNVRKISAITDPAIEVAMDEVGSFYLLNYLGDSLKKLLN